MGSRRIGRKRLYALNKAGETLTSTAGAAMEGNIGSQTRLRDGEIIATDITIDLASSAGAAHSFSVASANVNIGTTAIGVSSVLAAVGPQVIGSSTALDPDIDLDNKYLYLVHSGSGADNYTAGKFVIRLYGYNVFDDV